MMEVRGKAAEKGPMNLAVGTGELGRTSLVGSATGSEDARRAVVVKGEAAVGGGLSLGAVYGGSRLQFCRGQLGVVQYSRRLQWGESGWVPGAV